QAGALCRRRARPRGVAARQPARATRPARIAAWRSQRRAHRGRAHASRRRSGRRPPGPRLAQAVARARDGAAGGGRRQMSARPLVDDRTLERLTEYAAGWTGFSPDAILPDAIRRAVLSLGGTPEELVVRAAVRDRAVVHALCQAVSVGETFFFRHPDQFRWVTSDFIPGLIASKR